MLHYPGASARRAVGFTDCWTAFPVWPWLECKCYRVICLSTVTHMSQVIGLQTSICMSCYFMLNTTQQINEGKKKHTTNYWLYFVCLHNQLIVINHPLLPKLQSWIKLKPNFALAISFRKFLLCWHNVVGLNCRSAAKCLAFHFEKFWHDLKLHIFHTPAVIQNSP